MPCFSVRLAHVGGFISLCRPRGDLCGGSNPRGVFAFGFSESDPLIDRVRSVEPHRMVGLFPCLPSGAVDNPGGAIGNINMLSIPSTAAAADRCRQR